ncbi:MAG: hypothetical protein QM784_23160 [Polyangiaceae bacterium]
MRHRAHLLTWLILGMGGSACAPQSAPVAPPPARVTTVSIHQTQNVPEPPNAPIPEQRAGRITAEHLSDVRGTFVERTTRGGFDYLRVRLEEPRNSGPLLARPLVPLCEGKLQCFGVWSEENELLVRMKSGDTLPSAVVLRARGGFEYPYSSHLTRGLEQRVVLSGAPEIKSRIGARAVFRARIGSTPRTLRAGGTLRGLRRESDP